MLLNIKNRLKRWLCLLTSSFFVPQLALAIRVLTQCLKAVLCNAPPAVPPAPAERFPQPDYLLNFPLKLHLTFPCKVSFKTVLIFIYFYIYSSLQKVKYDIWAEIVLSTCTLRETHVLGSYSKIQPATRILSTRCIVLAKSQLCRSNF